MSGKQKNNRQSATRNLPSANGFSLLELIITLGVLAILVMGTIPLAQNANYTTKYAADKFDYQQFASD